MLTIMVLAYLWMVYAPRLFPGLFPQPKPKAPVEVVDDFDNVDKPPEAPVAAQDPKPEKASEEKPAEEKPAVYEHVSHVLGSSDPSDPYYLKVTLNSVGACVESAEFNDPRYKTVAKPHDPLKILGFRPNEKVATWQTDVAAIDAQLKKTGGSLRTVDWQLQPGADVEHAEFRYQSPDQSLEVRKLYRLKQGGKDRDSDPAGYLLETELTLINLNKAEAGKNAPALNAKYRVQGPTGAPLEDPANQRMFTNIRIGALETPTKPDSVTAIATAADAVVKQIKTATDNNDPSAVKIWRAPLKYAGVDVQFFTALIVPEDQLKDNDGDKQPDPYFAEVRPMVTYEDEKHPERSDVSIQMTSRDLPLKAGESVTHRFQTYLGPKRWELLGSIGADPIIDRGGWITFPFIWSGLLSLMQFYHSHLHLVYGLAIIGLTLTVRMLMLPISIKQMVSSERMKKVAPELKAIKEKYANEPEKFLGAQREVYKRHGINPLAGCLPVFVSLPIYVALYSAIYSAVDLRLSRFLWIDNLAAPDHLFPLGFEVPWFGWTQFNLLPLITVGLFLWQSKSTMPPATNEQEEMQQKMMTWMMVMMGFMFYKVPAGLCVYFIASSLWGMCERKILNRLKPHLFDPNAVPPPPSDGPGDPKKKPVVETTLAKKGFWDTLQQMADEARKNTGSQSPNSKRK